MLESRDEIADIATQLFNRYQHSADSNAVNVRLKIVSWQAGVMASPDHLIDLIAMARLRSVMDQ